MKHVIVVGLIAAAVIGLVFLAVWYDPQARELRMERAEERAAESARLAELVHGVRAALIVSLGVGGAIGIGLALVGLGVFLFGSGLKRAVAALVIADASGVVPQLLFIGRFASAPQTPGHEREVKALTHGNVDRLTGSGGAVKQLIEPEQPFELAAKSDLAPDVVLRPNPEQAPHTLIVGQSGSGKTNTLRAAVAAYRATLPDAEFRFCSMVAKDWPAGDVRATPGDILQTLAFEVQEMMSVVDPLMQSAGVRRFADLPHRPPYQVLVLDEVEAVYDSLQDMSRADARMFKLYFRQLARMGRNYGVLLILCTQLARRDMFDPTIIGNMSSVLIHRVTPATAASFNLYEPALVQQLAALPTGRAYSLSMGAFVDVPYTDQLAPVATRQPQPQPAQTLPPATTPTRQLDPGRKPTPEEAEAMRRYMETNTMTDTCFAFYGYKDKAVLDYVRDAKEGRL